MILESSKVQYNTANDSSYGGGGIYGYIDGALIISDTLVYSNSATAGYGGGVYVYGYGGIYVINSVFEENRADSYGGGIYVDDEASVYVQDSVFRTNQGSYGGAIYLEEEAAMIIIRLISPANPMPWLTLLSSS